MPFNRRNRLFAGLLLAFILLLSGCGGQYENTLICDAEPWCQYGETAVGILPGRTVRHEYKGMLAGLKEGAAVETCDYIALPALEIGAAERWYPQYLATVVIAVDRSLTDAVITGWNDLVPAGVTVGMSDRVPEIRLLMNAIAYGLEGESYTLGKAAELLAKIHRENRLSVNNYGAPVVICFDHQAAALTIAGRPMEIVVPREGTLTFEKGLLSDSELSLSEDTDNLLLAAGFRLPGGSADRNLYPAENAYAPAFLSMDYGRISRLGEDATFVFKRDVFSIGSYIYSSEDGREHQLFALLFIILVIIWTGYFLRRIIQKGVRLAIIAAVVLIIGWVFVRMLKYQVPLGTLSQYLWYGYYFFQLGLGLVILWMSWLADKPENVLYPPRWWRVCACVNALLFLLVFTNNLHHLAFAFSPDNPNYSLNYTYGPVYYLSIVTIFIEIFAAQIIFLRKSWKSPRRVGFLFPVAFYVLMISYCVCYIFRVPFVWETDLTVITGIAVLLFIETSIRVRLIPVNAKYKDLFSGSPLRIQLVGPDGEVSLASAPDGSEPRPENRLLYSDAITGGTVVWQEDISSINRLRAKTEASVAKLRAVGAMLMEEERIKSRLASAEQRSALFLELEAEIAQKDNRLSGMIKALPEGEDYKTHVAAITLLLCYIKRRCNLFFREREIEELPLSELAVYLDELSEFAEFAGVRMLAACDSRESVTVRRAILFYDFVYAALEWALGCQCRTVLAQIVREHGEICAKLLHPECGARFAADEPLKAAVRSAGGAIHTRDLDDSVSVRLSFQSGGERDA